MGFTIVPDKANGDVFTEAMWDTYIKDNLNTGVPVLLGESTLGATTASVTFSSIPSSWAHLLVVGYCRTDNAVVAQDCAVRFNSDTGANYDRQYHSGAAAATGAGETFGATSAAGWNCPGASAGANLFGAFDLWVPYYANSANNKTFCSEWNYKHGTSSGNLGVGVSAGFWRSNSAITSLTLLPQAGSFVSGCRFSLWGYPG